MTNAYFQKIAILSTMTLLLTALLSACGSNAKSVNGTDTMASGGQEDTKVDTIMVSEVYHNLLYLPLYVANNQGFLEQNRIELSSIRAAGSGPTALSSVISGESAFSFHGPEHVAFANAKVEMPAHWSFYRAALPYGRLRVKEYP